MSLPSQNASFSHPPSAGAGSRKRERLPESASLLLDVIRFGLAVIVVVGHATLPWFSTAWPPLLGWADVAVPGFFVLSGFMIRYVTESRERDPRRYFISRASRMYSVLLPAVLLTLLCRAIALWRAPLYARFIFRPEGAATTTAQVAAHLLFFTQYWGRAVLLPPNLPLWSLGYEVPYYVLFGLLVLCVGRWRLLAAALYAVALGPQVLFLLPLWWSGCWMFDLWQWSRHSRTRETITALVALFMAALLVVPLAPGASSTLWVTISRLPHPLLRLHQPSVRATMLAYAAGLVAWALMLLGLCLSDTLRLSPRARWAQPVRRLAEGTFTLYLFHYPLLCLVAALHGHSFTSARQTLAWVAAIVAVSVAASAPIDALKTWMRRTLSLRFMPPPRDVSTAAQALPQPAVRA